MKLTSAKAITKTVLDNTESQVFYMYKYLFVYLYKNIHLYLDIRICKVPIIHS